MFKVVTTWESGKVVGVLGLTPDEIEQLRRGTGLYTGGPAQVCNGLILCRAESQAEFETFLERFQPGGEYDDDTVRRVM
jgi:hypothetical protein